MPLQRKTRCRLEVLTDEQVAAVAARRAGEAEVSGWTGEPITHAAYLVRLIRDGKWPEGVQETAPSNPIERPPKLYAPPTHRNVRASDDTTLREIALSVRDLVKSGLMTADQVAERHRVSPFQAEQIVEACRMGLLDGEHASEVAVGPHTASALPGTVEREGVGNILVIGDTHIPFEHPGYLEHCDRARREFDCTWVVHIGDEVDNHAISYHESDPDGWSAGHEAEVAQRRLRDWYEAFPQCDVVVGNHGALPYRKAFSAGLPRKFVKTYEEVWDAPAGWKWATTFSIDGSMFEHGIGSGGKNGALNTAIAKGMNYVQGHAHSYGGVQYHSAGGRQLFGMNVCCGVDIDGYAMAYGKAFAKKPTLGCGVVLDGGTRAFYVPMP